MLSPEQAGFDPNTPVESASTEESKMAETELTISVPEAIYVAAQVMRLRIAAIFRPSVLGDVFACPYAL